MAARHVDFEIDDGSDGKFRVWTTNALACDGPNFVGMEAECVAWIVAYRAQRPAPSSPAAAADFEAADKWATALLGTPAGAGTAVPLDLVLARCYQQLRQRTAPLPAAADGTDWTSVLRACAERFQSRPVWKWLKGSPAENDVPVIAATLVQETLAAERAARAAARVSALEEAATLLLAESTRSRTGGKNHAVRANTLGDAAWKIRALAAPSLAEPDDTEE